MGDRSEAHQIHSESVVMSEITISLIMHPEHGEMVLLRESNGTEGDIPPGEKLKMMEMAKIFLVEDILAKTRTIE